MGKVADHIRRGLEEALAYAEGRADAARYGVQKVWTRDDSNLSEKHSRDLARATNGRISRR